MTKIPTKIKILGVDFNVCLDFKMPDSLDGECCTSTRKIRINPNREMSVQVETLFHEISHCILGLSGHSELLTDQQEESLCTLLGVAWLLFIQDNKKNLPVNTKKK